jgi:hypothetical protein
VQRIGASAVAEELVYFPDRNPLTTQSREESTRMKKSLLASLAVLLLVTVALAQEPAKLTVAKADTIRTILEKHAGQRVSVKLESGEELTGVVRSVGDRLVHLGELTGKEYFDAVVDHDKIAAVVIRMRGGS